jgi:hypothetical protein
VLSTALRVRRSTQRTVLFSVGGVRCAMLSQPLHRQRASVITRTQVSVKDGETMTTTTDRPRTTKARAGKAISQVKPVAAGSAPFGSSDTLQTFTLDDLAQYTREGEFAPNASPDFRVFYVGRDDVHGVLVHLFSRIRLSVKMNMFGYDDDQLNQILFGLAQDPTIMVQVTLDKSQASGAHEKLILASDEANDPTGYAADFAVGESDTHQISHTKGVCSTELLPSRAQPTGPAPAKAPELI